MRSVIYSMSVSLDGYIAGPGGSFDWTTPDEEVFRFWTDQTRELDAHVMGRRLYESMLYWETADENPALDFDSREWVSVWRPLPKVVFSTRLSAVEGMPGSPPAAWSRRSSGCGPSREMATSGSVAPASPARPPSWV